MFYLGSRVVGRFHPEGSSRASEEAVTQVDVIVPRRGQSHSLQALRSFLDPGRVLAVTHQFQTRLPEGPDEALLIHQRARDLTS